MIGLQDAIGFPIERDLQKEAKDGSGMGMGGFGGLGGGKDSKSEPMLKDMFRVSWQIPLYLTVLLLLGAAGTSFLDGGGATKARRKTYNFDDDDDENDDLAPAEEETHGRR